MPMPARMAGYMNICVPKLDFLYPLSTPRITLYVAGDHRPGGGEAQADPEGEGAGREA